jgi:hypothetical protein
MEGITLLVSIILIVFGVLQIILFFKLWGMANDMRQLKEHFVPESKCLGNDTTDPGAKYVITIIAITAAVSLIIAVIAAI